MGLLLIVIGIIGGMACLVGGFFFWPLLLGAAGGFMLVVWGMQMLSKTNAQKSVGVNVRQGGKVVVSELNGRFVVSTFGMNNTGEEMGRYLSHKEAKNEASRLALLHNLDFVDETKSNMQAQ